MKLELLAGFSKNYNKLTTVVEQLFQQYACVSSHSMSR